MADFDLEALSLSELKKMQKDVEGGFHLSRSTRRKPAPELGYSLAELVGSKVKTTRVQSAAKSSPPKNPTAHPVYPWA